MSDSLKIQVIVDGSAVTAGMANVASAVDAATAKIKASFGSVANAPEGIQNALMILRNQATMSAEAVNVATAAINELGGSAAAAAPGVQSVGNAAGDTAVKLTAMDRAMAMASGRMAGAAVGAGMLGGSLGRVAAQAGGLGQVLAYAFPVLAVGLLVDMLGKAYEKLRDLELEGLRNEEAWQKIDSSSATALEHIDQQLDRVDTKIVEITRGKLAALQLEMTQIGDGSVQMAAHMLTLFDSIGTQIEKEIPFMDKVKDFYTFVNSNGLVLPNQGELAKAFGADLSKTLDTQGLAAGIEKVGNQIRIVNQQLAANPGDKQLQEYADQLIKVLALLEARQRLEGKEKDANAAEQVKERNAELEKAAEFNDKLIADTKRLAEEDLKALHARQALEKKADEALNKNDTSGDDLRDMEILANAQEQYDTARLTDVKNSAVAQIEVEQERVKELARLGKVSTDQEVAQLNALEQQKLQVEQAYLQKRMAEIEARYVDDDAQAYAKDQAEYSRLLTEKQKAEDQYLKNRQKNIDTASSTEQKTWTTLMNKINSGFDQSIQGLMHGTMTFGKAFATQLDSLLSDFVSFLAHKAEKWGEEQLLELALHSTFLTNLFGLDTANNAAKTAENATAAAAQVTQQAGVAGAAAFASVMASLPFPLNVATAPGVMAAAISTDLSNLSLASAAGGWDVPHDSLAMVHQNEMILPASLSSGIKGLIGSGGGGPQISIQMGDVQAIDAKGVQDVLTKQSAHLVKLMQKELRRTNAI